MLAGSVFAERGASGMGKPRMGIEHRPHPASTLGRPSVWPLFPASVPTVLGGTHGGWGG